MPLTLIPQSHAIALDMLKVSLGCIIGIHRDEQQGGIVQGLEKPHLFLHDIPDPSPQQAANLPRQQVRSADGGLCPLQQGVTHYHSLLPSGAPAGFWLRCHCRFSRQGFLPLACYQGTELNLQLQICRQNRSHPPVTRSQLLPALSTSLFAPQSNTVSGYLCFCAIRLWSLQGFCENLVFFFFIIFPDAVQSVHSSP